MKKIIIIGAGGFGREVAWIIDRINSVKPTWELLGFLDDNLELVGKDLNGYKVLGDLSYLSTNNSVFVVCAIGTAKTRESIVKRISQDYGVKFATLIDPSVLKSDFIEIGAGSIICAGTILTTNIKIGNHVIINLDCTIGHDAIINDFVTLYPSVNVSGCVSCGRNVELGTGSHIIQGIKIGNGTIVGAGSVVNKELPEECTAVGVPCKPIKFH